MKITEPICWKCNRAIFGSVCKNGAFPFIGCQEEKRIMNFDHAKTLCPLFKYKDYIFVVSSNRGTDERQIVSLSPAEYNSKEGIKYRLETWCENFGCWDNSESLCHYSAYEATPKNIKKYIDDWKQAKIDAHIKSQKRIEKAIVENWIKTLKDNPLYFKTLKNNTVYYTEICSRIKASLKTEGEDTELLKKRLDKALNKAKP